MKFLLWVLNVAAGFLGAFVMTKLWGWFVVPFGVIQVTLWHMVGLSLFYNILGLSSNNIKEITVFNELFKKNCKNVGKGDIPFVLVSVWLLTWGVGYLIHLGM